jgi:hypothetical protein
MRKIFLFLILACLRCFAQQGLSNSFNVSQFPGVDVGTKLTNAQAQCVSSMNCILEIDPILSFYPLGTLPTRCANCVWLDYRTSAAMKISSATSPFLVGTADIPTLQAAITAACTAGGGWVQMPNGTWAAPNLSNLTLCTGLKLTGPSRAQADAGPCPATITSNQTSGDLFAVVNMTDIYLADFCVKGLGTGGGDVISLNYGQRVTAERLFIFANGAYSGGIHLKSSSASTASTIWNSFRDIHINGIAAGGFGCALESSDAVAKVINNNVFTNVSCIGGTGGIGFKTTGANQVVNENFVISGELQAPSGTAVSIGNSSVRNLKIQSSNIEGSTTGISIGTGVTGSISDSNVSANSVNVVDNSAGGFNWFTAPAGVTRNWGVDSAGNQRVNSICIGSGACDPGNFTCASGCALEASGTTVVNLNNTNFGLNQPLANLSKTFATLPGSPSNGWQVYCSDCTVANPCASGGSGALAKRINGAWVCN